MKTKYVEGAGLFRLIGENLTKSESEDVKKQIEAHEHGVSTQWAQDVDTIDDVTPIEGTYKVWQRIMRSVGMREEIHESTQPYDEHEQMRVLRTQFRDRFDDLNAKVNIFIIIGGVLAWLGIGAYWYNVAKFTGLESACLMLVVALAIMTLAWLWCINHTCDTR